MGGFSMTPDQQIYTPKPLSFLAFFNPALKDGAKNIQLLRICLVCPAILVCA
jgi:hypothetical protein